VRMAVIVFASVIAFVLWVVMSWRPVVPEVDDVIARILSSISGIGCAYLLHRYTGNLRCTGVIETIAGGFKWILSKIKACSAFLYKHRFQQFGKVYLSFFQILGSFGMFGIEWPPLFASTINWLKATLGFDLLKLPSVSCLWHSVNFQTYLHTYTLAPLVLIAMLALPLLAAWFWGLHVTAVGRNREAYDRFWTNLMFSFFTLYPALSISTMSVFNCDQYIGRLRDDYREVCPHFLSGKSLYSMVFFFLYPIGIPVTMYLALRFAGIVGVVKEKVENTQFHAARALFMTLYVTVEMHRFARLVGNVDDNEEEFLRQAKQEFDRLLAVQGDGGDELDLEKMRNIAKKAESSAHDKTLAPATARRTSTFNRLFSCVPSVTNEITRPPSKVTHKASARMEVESQAHMVGMTWQDVCIVLQVFDANGDGKTDFPAFCTMIKEARYVCIYVRFF